MAETETVRRSPMPTSYPEDDLADGRAALLSGWSTGSEPGLVITRASGALVWDAKGNEYVDCTSTRFRCSCWPRR
jgi:4-aminobutyrate aminotransferase-like enzyme